MNTLFASLLPPAGSLICTFPLCEVELEMSAIPTSWLSFFPRAEEPCLPSSTSIGSSSPSGLWSSWGSFTVSDLQVHAELHEVQAGLYNHSIFVKGMGGSHRLQGHMRLTCRRR